jgi:hypothetical protein
MAVAALRNKSKLKTFHATVHVTRVEEWYVEAERRNKRATCWLPALAVDARSGSA